MQTLNCTIVHLRLFKSAKIDGVMDEILHHLLKKGEKSSKSISVSRVSNEAVGLEFFFNYK